MAKAAPATDFTELEIRSYYQSRIHAQLKRTGKEYRLPCPLHKGTRDSFAIDAETGGWYCHSECNRGGSIFDFETAITGINGQEARRAVLDQVGRASDAGQKRIIATYDYTDEYGELLYQVVRFEPKEFRQRRKTGENGWVWNLSGVRRVLYRLPEVMAAPIVFVVEGEKDADALTRWGLTATCNAMGAGKWREEYTGYLEGKDVYVIPDTDKPGWEHAVEEMRSLTGAGIQAKMIRLPRGKDTSEWMEAGGTLEELVGLTNGKGEIWEEAARKREAGRPKVVGAVELMEMNIRKPGTMIGGRLPGAGACLVIGAQKCNKTLVSLQLSIAIAADHPLFDWFPREGARGPVLFVERDDPAAELTVQGVLKASPVVKGMMERGEEIPFYLYPKVDLTLGTGFNDWLGEEIGKYKAKLVVLDSYTALRPARNGGGDIVKLEYGELALIDELGKRTNTLIAVIHHDSKGSADLDWSQKAGGSFGLTAAVEGQVHISRFPELSANAKERLVRIRGRHIADTEMVLRFRAETLDHELVVEGGAAPLYPMLIDLKRQFGRTPFKAAELAKRTGVHLATAYRHLGRLCYAGALHRSEENTYQLVIEV